MKISEPATIEQARALPRALSARGFGYACLILLALVSRDAVAQTTINVTFQPGETTKTVQTPRAATFMVHVTTPEYLCNWPTTAQIKTRIETAANAGQLPQLLTQIESPGAASGTAIVQALDAFSFYLGGSYPVVRFSGTQVSITEQAVAARSGTPYSLIDRCLTVAEARTGVNEILRVIRAYSGLPALQQMQLLIPAN